MDYDCHRLIWARGPAARPSDRLVTSPTIASPFARFAHQSDSAVAQETKLKQRVGEVTKEARIVGIRRQPIGELWHTWGTT